MKQAMLMLVLTGCTAELVSSSPSRGAGPAYAAPMPREAPMPRGAPRPGEPPAPLEPGPPPAPTPGSPTPAIRREAAPADARIPPGNWTLQEKEYWIKLQDELDEYVARANAACGSNIRGRFVHDSFRGQFTAGGGFGLGLDTRAMCGAMAGALVEVCNGGATAKQAVAAEVHQIVCEYGPARYTISGGVFRSAINTSPATLETHYNAMLAVIRKSL